MCPHAVCIYIANTIRWGFFFSTLEPRLAQCTRWMCSANEAAVQVLFLCSLFAVQPHVSWSACHPTFGVNQTRLHHNSLIWSIQPHPAPCLTHTCDHVYREHQKALTSSFPNFVYQSLILFLWTFLLRIPRDVQLFSIKIIPWKLHHTVQQRQCPADRRTSVPEHQLVPFLSFLKEQRHFQGCSWFVLLHCVMDHVPHIISSTCLMKFAGDLPVQEEIDFSVFDNNNIMTCAFLSLGELGGDI